MAKLDEHESPTLRKKPVAKSAPADAPKSELRGRGLVYIDTDDDVTSIVGKIKSSSDAVVALVPPKRIGVLQSVVNLKLLQRAAKMANKRLAIVTVDPALVNLASGLAIPVAKNINAQAKVPDMTDDDEISDVIDGSELSVGDLDRAGRQHNAGPAEDKDISAAVAAIETDDRIKNDMDADGVPDDEQRQPAKKPAKKVKVPNVNDLRKKIILIGGGVVIIAAFLVWAIVFAPHAVITIKARTSAKEVSKTLSLIPSTDRDADKGILSPVVKQKKTNESVQFDATGTKEEGDKASGSVAFCNPNTPFDAQTGKKNDVTVPAGTLLYANGVQFVTAADVTVEAVNKCSADSTYYSTKVTAVNIGTEGNIAQGTKMNAAGFSSLVAVAKDDFSGGSKNTVKVVQQSDIDAAVAKLKEKGNSDAAKEELKGQMSSNTVVIDSSFSVSQGDIKTTPAVGEKPNGQAQASVEITYTLIGVNKSDLKEVLGAQLKNDAADNQKVYRDGVDDVEFAGFESTDKGYTVVAKTKAHVGPVIDENEIKKSVVGKKSEEIKALVKQIDGVEDVEATMSPFWVSKAPAAGKITINFTIDE